MSKQEPTVLIYKRTHKGDPCQNGVFGVGTCMGSVRDWEYDAVIGIGGESPEPVSQKIAYKINWIGKNPKQIEKSKGAGRRGHLITFEKFCLYEDKGILVKKVAPKLHRYMYGEKNRRHIKISSSKSEPPERQKVYKEVLEILKQAKRCPPSKVCSRCRRGERLKPPERCQPSKGTRTKCKTPGKCR